MSDNVEKLQGAAKTLLFVFSVGASVGAYIETQNKNTESITALEASVSIVYQKISLHEIEDNSRDTVQTEQIKHLSESK